MPESTHRKIRRFNKDLVTKRSGGKKPFVAPVKVERGPILMASETVGTKADSSSWLCYREYNEPGTTMLFSIDTRLNTLNSTDNTFIIPFELYTITYPLSIDWGDGVVTNIISGTQLTQQLLTHVYSTAGVYTIYIKSEEKKIPTFNLSLFSTINNNHHKVTQFNSPLIKFDVSCPNSYSASHFADGAINLEHIPYGFFKFNDKISNFDYAFNNTSKLTHIPYDLLWYVTSPSSYQYFLSNSDTRESIPEELFSRAHAVDLSNALTNNTSLTAYIDVDKFFGEQSYVGIDVHELFKGCSLTTGDAKKFVEKFTKDVPYIEGNGTIDTGYGTLTGKIYPQDIYDGDTLVRDLVPAKSGYYYNGKLAPQNCLYDSVSDTFLLPTSAFSYGTEQDQSGDYESNLPINLKRDSLMMCEKWDNFAIPDTVWTGIPTDTQTYLAVESSGKNWIVANDKNPFLLGNTTYAHPRVDVIDKNGNVIAYYKNRNLDYIVNNQSTIYNFALGPSELYGIYYSSSSATVYPITVETDILLSDGRSILRNDGSVASYSVKVNGSFSKAVDTALIPGSPVFDNLIYSSHSSVDVKAISNNKIYKMDISTTPAYNPVLYSTDSIVWDRVYGPGYTSGVNPGFCLATDTSKNIYLLDMYSYTTPTLLMSYTDSFIGSYKIVTNNPSSSSVTYMLLCIVDGALYSVIPFNNTADIILVDNTHTWIDCCSQLSNNRYAITDDHKLFSITGSTRDNLVLQQIGSDTGWIKFGGSATLVTVLKDGDIYTISNNSTSLLISDKNYLNIIGVVSSPASTAQHYVMLAYTETR